MKNERYVNSKLFGNKYIEKAIEEAEEELNSGKTIYYTHNEIFSKAREKINTKNYVK